MLASQPTAVISDLPSFNELKDRWLNLESRADGSFFTSWAWIAPLINLSETHLTLFSAQVDGKDIALAIIGYSKNQKFWGRSDRLHLNQSGSSHEDITYPEFNDILSDRNWQAQAIPLLFTALKESVYGTCWTDLQLCGVQSSLILRFESAVRLERGHVTRLPTPFVDLQHVRTVDGNYLSCMSSNTRSQIRRSVRLFEQSLGKLSIQPIREPVEIEAALEKMCEFHHVRFADQSESSAFENPFFREFLSNLLVEGTASQSDSKVDLLELTAGSSVLGYLIILVYRGMAANYQTGFTSVSDNRLKPGLVAHCLTIQHYAERNMDTYQFLAGNQQYKKSLATNEGELHWVKLHRPTKSPTVASSIRRLKSANSA